MKPFEMAMGNSLDVKDLLVLMANPKAAAEYVAKLEALSDEIALQIDIKATLDETKVLRAQAENANAEASRILLQAREDATRIRADADRVEKEARERLSPFEIRLVAERNAFETARTIAEDAFKTRESIIKEKEQALSDAQAKANSRVEWAEQTVVEYRTKFTRLKEFVSSLGL